MLHYFFLWVGYPFHATGFHSRLGIQRNHFTIYFSLKSINFILATSLTFMKIFKEVAMSMTLWMMSIRREPNKQQKKHTEYRQKTTKFGMPATDRFFEVCVAEYKYKSIFLHRFIQRLRKFTLSKYRLWYYLIKYNKGPVDKKQIRTENWCFRPGFSAFLAVKGWH